MAQDTITLTAANDAPDPKVAHVALERLVTLLATSEAKRLAGVHRAGARDLLAANVDAAPTKTETST